MSVAYRLIVGSYTRPVPYVRGARGAGICVYDVNAETGALTLVQTISGIDNPSYLALHPSGTVFYATSEVPDWHEGTLTAFSIHPQTGSLTYLNKQSSLGKACAYAHVAPQGHAVMAVNYEGGAGVVLYPLYRDGRLAPATDAHIHSGAALVNPQRQEASHPHCILSDQNGKYMFVSDLGTDQIVTYRYDAQMDKLVPHSMCALPAGAGPRHVVLHPQGDWLYSVNELHNTVSFFTVNAGNLQWQSDISTLPHDFDGESWAAEIRMTPNGRFLYVSNRLHDSLAMFAVQADGSLRALGHQPTGGKIPRHFVIAPDGRFLFVGNQDSDTLVTLRIDPASGILHETGSSIVCQTPACAVCVARIT